jgi:hypothetical protein
MSMRKLITIPVALVALVVTGYAVADGVQGGNNPSAVAGTFTAAGASTSSRSCTTSDGRTIVVTNGVYTGAAAGDADLAGAITLRARSVVDTSTGVGLVSGALKIDVASGRNTTAAFTAVYDHGQVAGLAAGHARTPRARLVANLSAGFDPAAGFTNGKLGGGTAGGLAIEVTPRACKPAKQTPEHSAARGTVSDVSATSITVAGLTCAIPSGSDAGSKVAKGDVVQIRCALKDGTNTLVSIKAKRH